MKIIFLKKKNKKSKSRKGNFPFVLSHLPGIEYNWGRSVAHKEIICLLNSVNFLSRIHHSWILEAQKCHIRSKIKRDHPEKGK